VRAHLPISAAVLALSVSFAHAGSPDPAVLKSGKEVVDLLTKEDFKGVHTRFDATMRMSLTEEALKGTWKKILSESGAFKKVADTTVDKEQGFDVVVARCEMEHGFITVKVVLNTNRQVSGLWVKPAAP
jgi:hypothetical protein